jgi:hypothetical protein
MRVRRALVVITVVLGLWLVSPAWSDCAFPVYRSRAYNDWNEGVGWCEGWWSYDCIYCWTTQGGGGTCATNLTSGCSPRFKKDP